MHAPLHEHSLRAIEMIGSRKRGYAPINVKPQGGGGGGATHGKLTERAFPRVGNLTWPPSWKTERNWK